MSDAPPTSDDRVIAGMLPCIRCGYDLDKRSLASLCPECGNPAALSLDSLWLETPEYINRLRRGVNQMMWAALIGPLVYLSAMAIAVLQRRMSGQADQAVAVVGGVLLSFGPVLAWRGAALLASPRKPRYRFATNPEVRDRLLRVARQSAAAYAACFALVALLVLLESLRYSLLNGRISLVFAIVAGLFWSLRNVLILSHIRAMARAACIPKIVRTAPAMQAWAGINALAGGFMGLVLFFESMGWWYAPRVAGAFIYGSIIVWVIAWPLLLARFNRGLRIITRQFAGQGQPAILEPAMWDFRAARRARRLHR